MEELLVQSCPVCSSARLEYRFVAAGRVISACAECGHMFSNPQNTRLMELQPLYRAEDFSSFRTRVGDAGEPAAVPSFSSEEELSKTADGSLESLLLDCLDTGSNPERLLRSAHAKLKPEGKLFLFVPVTDSSHARHAKQSWDAFEQKRLQFFSRKTLENLLCKCGFGEITIREANPDGVFVRCSRKEVRKEKVLSFIIPVYNEKNTVRFLLDAVYGKDLSGLGLRKELIIIESNSSDGTREEVARFAAEHPEVRAIYEDKPRGKGHAVRNGFREATGDFITIQDGDLEYDINDYDKLLYPLVHDQEAFVLGSRHTGDWHMRKFGSGEKLRAFVMNLGQIFFTGLINRGCHTKLKDPFTMFKLFRRECLYGLEFDGNRFEIDWEIIIKLIRKGYIPREIPINYVSRGVKEGKKVRMIQDPILWIKSFIRYRYLYRMPQ